MSFDYLPSTWCAAQLSEICHIEMGQSPPSETYNAQMEGLPFFQGKAEFGDYYPTIKKWCRSPVKVVEKNTILISVRAPVGPTNISPEKCCIGRGLAGLTPNRSISVKYLLYSLRSNETKIAEKGAGSAFDAISSNILREFKIPIAPINEQKLIVDKLEELFSDLDAGIAALERAKTNLKRYRASVLKAAVEGKLTAEWRRERAEGGSKNEEGRSGGAEDNSSFLLQPSSLLARILKERRAKWEENQLKKFAEQGKTPPKNWRDKYPEPNNPDISDLAGLPSEWCLASWDQVGFSQNGRPFPSAEYSGSGIKLLRPGNLHENGKLEWTAKNTKYMPKSYEADNLDLIIKEGDIVINLTAQSLKDEFLGRVCLAGAGEYCLLNQRLARLTPILIQKEFALILLKSWRFRRFVDTLNTGSLIQHMFTSQLASFTFYLPPISEQAQIVAEVERRLSIADATEKTITHALTRAARLRQAILKRAFEGRLVPQDPNDEPASELLKRIQAERAREMPAQRKPRRKTVPAST